MNPPLTDAPVAGFYRMRLRSGGQPVGVRVWFGPPADPVTGEELDRSWRWQATVNGRLVDLDRVWPQCARDPVDQAEHDHLAALQAWAVEHAPATSLADPRRKPDPLSNPIPF